METLFLIAKINLYWILLFCFYHLLLRKQTFFRLNRVFLTVSLIATPCLAMIEFTETVTIQRTGAESAANPFSSYSPVLHTANGQTHLDWSLVLFLVYALVAMVMFGRLLRGIYTLRKLIVKGEILHFDDFTLVLLPADKQIGSFSFFNYMVVSHQDYEHCFELIMQHESVHIRERHSYDILLVEILKALFWFNPVLTSYKNAFREVHEYLADEGISEKGAYATFLVSYAKENAFGRFVNQFYNASLLKNRIHMLYQNPSPRSSYLRYLLVVPMLAITVMLTAARVKTVVVEYHETDNVTSTNTIKQVLNEEIEKNEFVKPQIKKAQTKIAISKDTIPDGKKNEKVKFMNYRTINSNSPDFADTIDIAKMPKKFWTSSPAMEQAIRDREKVDEFAQLTFPTTGSARYSFNQLFSDSTKTPKTAINYGGGYITRPVWPYPPVRIIKGLKIEEP